MITTAIRLAFAAAAVLPQTPAPRPGHSLMPVPAALVGQPGLLRLDSTFGVSGATPGDGRLQRAVARTLARLERRIGVGVAKSEERRGGGLILEVARPGEAVQSPDEDESYRLEVTPAGARLQAATTVGALRGLETLLQLVESDSAGWYLPAVRIEDTPRFP